MQIAGITLANPQVLELAARLRAEGFEATAIPLGRAFDQLDESFGLTVIEREQVLRALADCPEELSAFRATRLGEHDVRKQEGLAQEAARPPTQRHPGRGRHTRGLWGRAALAQPASSAITTGPSDNADDEGWLALRHDRTRV